MLIPVGLVSAGADAPDRFVFEGVDRGAPELVAALAAAAGAVAGEEVRRGRLVAGRIVELVEPARQVRGDQAGEKYDRADGEGGPGDRVRQRPASYRLVEQPVEGDHRGNHEN